MAERLRTEEKLAEAAVLRGGWQKLFGNDRQVCKGKRTMMTIGDDGMRPVYSDEFDVVQRESDSMIHVGIPP